MSAMSEIDAMLQDLIALLQGGGTQYFTEEEVAAKLKLKSVRHLARNRSRHPHIRIAGEVRYTQEHIKALAAMYERNGGGVGERPTTVATLQEGRARRGGRSA